MVRTRRLEAMTRRAIGIKKAPSLAPGEGEFRLRRIDNVAFWPIGRREQEPHSGATPAPSTARMRYLSVLVTNVIEFCL